MAIKRESQVTDERETQMLSQGKIRCYHRVRVTKISILLSRIASAKQRERAPSTQTERERIGVSLPEQESRIKIQNQLKTAKLTKQL